MSQNIDIEPLISTISNELVFNKERHIIDKCPVCHGNDFDIINPLKPIVDCQPVICNQCGFITYDKYLKDLDKFYAKHTRPQTYHFLRTKEVKKIKHKNLIFKFLDKNNIKPKSVLDYGCSDGYLLKMFKERYDNIKEYGIELNRGHLNWAKYYEKLNVSDDTDSIKGKYDVLVLYHVLEHILEPDKFMNKILKNLNQNGYIYIALPTLDRLDYPNLQSGNCFFKDEHINIFTDSLLKKFLENFGLEVQFEDFDTYGTCYILKYTKHNTKHDFNCGAEIKVTLENVLKIYKIKEEFIKLMGTGKKSEAYEIGIQGIQIYERFPEFIKMFTSVLDPLDAQDFLIEMINRQPSMIDLRTTLAILYFNDKEFEKAKDVLQECIIEFGYNDMAYQTLAQIYVYTNEINKCIELYNTMIDKYPDENKINMYGAILSKL